MKKKFKIVNLDCANCAAKMEHAINKIEGVESAVVSFMAQKLTLTAEDEAFDKIGDLYDEKAEKCIVPHSFFRCGFRPVFSVVSHWDSRCR